MKTPGANRTLTLCLLAACLQAWPAAAQPAPSALALPTPLDERTTSLLVNEVSGQMAYDNLVRLAGAPWLRDRKEFGGTFQETQILHDLVRSYGVGTTRIERFPGTRTIDYPAEAEFWVVEPSLRLVARLGADAAGLQAIVSFNARDRYVDPNQVVHASGSYQGRQALKIGFTISWRQWSELFEDVQAAPKPIVVRCRTRIDSYPDRFEMVYTGSAGARSLVSNRLEQWQLYRSGLEAQAQGYLRLCAAQLGVTLPPPARPRPAGAGKPVLAPDLRVPAIDPSVKGREFALNENPDYAKAMQDPGALRKMGINRSHATAVLNWVNGRRTMRQVRDGVSADSGEEVPLEGVLKYLEFLRSIRWVTF